MIFTPIDTTLIDAMKCAKEINMKEPMEVINIRISKELKKEIEKISKKSKHSRSKTTRLLLELGMSEYKVSRKTQ